MGSALHHNSGILIPRDEYEELTEALATVLRIGSHFAPRLIERLDLADGDPDNEPGGDVEPALANGDCEDAAYIDWDQMRGSQKRGPNVLPTYNEDDEDDDPAEEDDDPGQCTEDEISSGAMADGWQFNRGPGCQLSDEGIADAGGFYD